MDWRIYAFDSMYFLLGIDWKSVLRGKTTQ